MKTLRLRRSALAIALSSMSLVPSIAPAVDFGKVQETALNLGSQALFGFGLPVQQASSTSSLAGNGKDAVQVAKGLSVKVISNQVGGAGDMIALWPNDENPTHSIVCNEDPNDDLTSPTLKEATVRRVRLADGFVEDMIFGHVSCDPAHGTPWGTVIVGEEAGPTGRLWEILDPLNVNGVVVDHTAGTSTDPLHVQVRAALGQLSYEGIVFKNDGAAYYADELRPSAGKPGGGLYKFVPATPYNPASGPIASLDQSPLVAGDVYVMRLGLRSNGANYGQGDNTGAGKWIGPLIHSDGNTPAPLNANLAAIALAAPFNGYTGYYRPEDMDVDPVAAARGQFRACWANTGNDTEQQWGEVMCLTDDATTQTGFNTGSMPVVTPFISGNPKLRMPDNVAFQPKTGILYVHMDASTAINNTATATFTNDDVWACLPDGADSDTLSDGCVRVMTLKDGTAEFTGGQFLADGKSFLIHLQHRGDGDPTRGRPFETDELLVSGLKYPLP